MAARRHAVVMSDEQPSASNGPTPHPVSTRDAAALIGLLSVLEATSLGDGLESGLADSLGSRLRRDGLTNHDQTQVALRAALNGLNGLNQRLRYALGSTRTPPEPDPVK